MSYQGKTTVIKDNPYANNLYAIDKSDYGDAPPIPGVKKMITEDGNLMITENFIYMITEG